MVDFVTVKFPDIYVCHRKDDSALQHTLADPRSKRVSPDEIVPIEHPSLDVAHTYLHSRGFGATHLAAMHFRCSGIEFDFIDVGANNGLHVCGQAKLHEAIGGTVECHAFEPGTVFEALIRTVKANRMDHVIRCNRAACGSINGKAVFYDTETSSPGSSLLRKAVAPFSDLPLGTIETPIVRIDDYVQKSMRAVPGLIIKIDREGADFQVLAGMSRVMAERACVVLTEFTPVLVEEYENPTRMLYQIGQDFFIVDMGAERRPLISEMAWLEASIAEIKKRPTEHVRGYTDLALISRRIPKAKTLFSRIMIG
jgi:FkbM family methyltransferase